jgi:hypothetical protein
MQEDHAGRPCRKDQFRPLRRSPLLPSAVPIIPFYNTLLSTIQERLKPPVFFAARSVVASGKTYGRITPVPLQKSAREMGRRWGIG